MQLTDDLARETSDIELVRKAREGVMSAFTVLVERYEERALRAAFAVLRDWEDARETAQDAFVKAHRSLHQYEERAQFFTWFYKILMNQTRDVLRKKKVRRHLAIFIPMKEGPDGSVAAEESIAGRQDVFREVSDQETALEIKRGLETLPIKQRMIFAMRYLDGLSIQEVTELTQVSEGTVKAQLWKAVQKMRKFLKLFLEAEGEL